MRELPYSEIPKLEPCLRELAEHHNMVSINFKGAYPKQPYAKTLRYFEEAVSGGESSIAVIDSGDRIVGFCKADVHQGRGTIDYLIVLRECRGKGYGDALMEWAMGLFRQCCVEQIEVKVADGNNAAAFYERFGFRMNAHLLRVDL